jgi:hypothetical protein
LAFSSRACTGRLRIVATRPRAPETAPTGQKEGPACAGPGGFSPPRRAFALAMARRSRVTARRGTRRRSPADRSRNRCGC